MAVELDHWAQCAADERIFAPLVAILWLAVAVAISPVNSRGMRDRQTFWARNVQRTASFRESRIDPERSHQRPMRAVCVGVLLVRRSK